MEKPAQNVFVCFVGGHDFIGQKVNCYETFGVAECKMY